MAENLARIYGTEEDKVNCPFYFKIGACRHGDRCSRTHNRPLFSQTLLIPHMYTLPPVDPQTGMPTVNEKEHLTDFCEEVIDELQNFGNLEEFHVVGNLGEHMLGNVYLKYSREEEAEAALKALNGRFYGGRQLTVEYSPVSDFRESRCRQYDEETCNRGGFCNFMHMRPLPSAVRKELDRIRDRARRRAERSSSRRDRSRSRDRDRRDDYYSSRDRSARSDRDRERDPRSAAMPGMGMGMPGMPPVAAPRDDRDRRDRSPRRSSDDRHRSSRSRDEQPQSSSSSSSRDQPQRSPSEERRARIAEWNRARDAKKAAESAGGAPAPQ